MKKFAITTINHETGELSGMGNNFAISNGEPNEKGFIVIGYIRGESPFFFKKNTEPKFIPFDAECDYFFRELNDEDEVKKGGKQFSIINNVE